MRAMDYKKNAFYFIYLIKFYKINPRKGAQHEE